MRLKMITGVVLALLGASAGAANFSFTGSFTRDDDVQLFRFAVAAPSLSTVTLLTLSYAGGTNAAGSPVPAGGFDPVISLFDATGALIGEADDGGATSDPVTGLALDAVLQIDLTAGDYVAALTQSPNFAFGPSLADGFELAGSGNFAGGFVDAFGNGNPRDGHWALDILSAASASVGAAVPEPPVALLLAVGLAGLAFTGKDGKTASDDVFPASRA